MARAQAMEAQGRDVIHLEIGQPDFDTPSHIALAGIQAIATGKTGYNPAPGIPALREALAEDAGRRRGIAVDPAQVVVAPGNKPLLYLPMQTILEPGDEVVLPDPGFPTYEVSIRMAGGVPVPVPLVEDEKQGFDLDLDALDMRLSPKTKIILINSPGNPTGGILSQRTLEHVAEASQRLDCWVLSDEVYSRLVYEGQHASILSLPGMPERTIMADGFSKTYSMTGWRLGFGIMPEPLAAMMDPVLTHAVGCTATFTQYAGLAAVLGSQDQADDMRDQFHKRRDIIVAGLNAIPGVHCPTPRGAFYVFANVSSLGWPVEELADYLLTEAGVALLAGTDFGQAGRGYLRLSYANSIENIREALARMAQALSELDR
jgi:aspartate/methionine/tyrosine aminotransferase